LAAFRTTFRVTGSRSKLPEEDYWKDIDITKVSDFIEENFILDCLHKKQSKIEETNSAHSKSILLIFRTQKNSSRDTIPLIEKYLNIL
jgi:hypothetical protein